MAEEKYRTAPLATEKMPPGIPYIVGNEAAERFSFYGMKAILAIFMTDYLMGSDGKLATMSDHEATSWMHFFVAGTYAFPLIGGIIADAFWGKYATILRLSLFYCLGHLALALDATRVGLVIGLGLIAVGAGGIKSCVSAHVGDQFGEQNQALLGRVFSWFYFAINFGAMSSMMLTPELLRRFGPHVAFGVPGVLMGVATLTFWAGRRRFAHIPPGGKRFLREAFSRQGLSVMLRLSIIYAFVAMFWALFDQTSSSWVLQAKRLDLGFMGFTWLPEQPQAANPVLVLLFIPLFAYVIYPNVDRVFKLTPLRKISIGLFLTVLAFLVPAYIESQLSAGHKPNIGWQFFAYVLMTAAEVMVSITALEFSYTQAPKQMKSLVMGLFFGSVVFGNLFTAIVNVIIENPASGTSLAGASYYLFFAATMLVTAVLFVPVAMWYKERTYIQSAEGEPEPTPA
ncbi:MAG TPA: POT family MFS transporter [Polyangiaceae bacterium]|nr:POT family MFS transporter [Polyangiaceae bacterium]